MTTNADDDDDNEYNQNDNSDHDPRNCVAIRHCPYDCVDIWNSPLRNNDNCDDKKPFFLQFDY